MRATSSSPRAIAARRSGSLLAALVAVLAVALTSGSTALAARPRGAVPRDVTAPRATPSVRAQSRAATPATVTAPACPVASDPAVDFAGCYATLLNRFFSDVAIAGPTDNVYGVAQQYGNGTTDLTRTYGFDPSHTAVVPDAWPADAPHGNLSGCQSTPGPHGTPYSWCITDAQLQSELRAVIAAHGWPTDMSSTYFVMLPPGIDECAGPFAEVQGSNQCADTDFCAYHSNATDPTTFQPTPPLYAVVPWPDVPGCQTGESPNGDPAADYGIDLISHEGIETANDPLGTGWFTDGANGAQDESADKCINTFAPATGPVGSSYNQVLNGHDYFLQDEFANADTVAANPNFNACEGKPGGGADTYGNGRSPPPTPPADESAPLAWHNGPTMHAVNAYTIYWDGHAGANPSAAIAALPGTVHRGETAAFQAAASVDPQGQAPTYTWSFGDGTSAAGQAVSHAYQVSGTYTTTLTVSDADGYAASDTRSVHVYAPPTASFTATPASAIAGSAVTFNSAASAAGDGPITGWNWSFGDGTSASGAHVSHAYQRQGIYLATLTLTDSNGSTGSETNTILVVPRAAAALSTRGPTRTARSGTHVLLLTAHTLRCSPGGSDCAVTLSVTTTRRVRARTARGRTIVTQTVTIATATLRSRPGSSTALQLRLSAFGQTLLRRSGHLSVTVQIVVRVPGAATIRRRLSATVTNPPSPPRRR